MQHEAEVVLIKLANQSQFCRIQLICFGVSHLFKTIRAIHLEVDPRQRAQCVDVVQAIRARFRDPRPLLTRGMGPAQRQTMFAVHPHRIVDHSLRSGE